MLVIFGCVSAVLLYHPIRTTHHGCKTTCVLELLVFHPFWPHIGRSGLTKRIARVWNTVTVTLACNFWIAHVSTQFISSWMLISQSSAHHSHSSYMFILWLDHLGVEWSFQSPWHISMSWTVALACIAIKISRSLEQLSLGSVGNLQNSWRPACSVSFSSWFPGMNMYGTNMVAQRNLSVSDGDASTTTHHYPSLFSRICQSWFRADSRFRRVCTTWTAAIFRKWQPESRPESRPTASSILQHLYNPKVFVWIWVNYGELSYPTLS